MYVSPTTPSWEDTFLRWAQPPGKTETTRCRNAEGAMRNAISKSPKLSAKNIKVFAQGSFRNRVNVRQDSDVDVGVLCWDTFLPDYPGDATHGTFGNTVATYSYGEFKNDLGAALAAYFGPSGVSRGNKAFDLSGNTYRVEADVAPFFEHRQYRWDGSYLAGVAMQPDRGGLIVNYPERLLDTWPILPLHYENGVARNTACHRRFKGVVRIIKTACNQMANAGVPAAASIPGFLIECLVWNAPEDCFNAASWTERVRSVLWILWSCTRGQAGCESWTEVNGVKRLFGPAQPWTRHQVHQFISEAWTFLGMQSA